MSKVRKGGGLISGDDFLGSTPRPRGVSSDRLAKRDEATPKGRSRRERGGRRRRRRVGIYRRVDKPGECEEEGEREEELLCGRDGFWWEKALSVVVRAWFGRVEPRSSSLRSWFVGVSAEPGRVLSLRRSFWCVRREAGG